MRYRTLVCRNPSPSEPSIIVDQMGKKRLIRLFIIVNHLHTNGSV